MSDTNAIIPFPLFLDAHATNMDNEIGPLDVLPGPNLTNFDPIIRYCSPLTFQVACIGLSQDAITVSCLVLNPSTQALALKHPSSLSKFLLLPSVVSCASGK